MLGPADRVRVEQAVARAEALSDGEIVTVVARSSDGYEDLALTAAALLMLAGLVAAALVPRLLRIAAEPFAGRWVEPAPTHVAMALALLAGVLLLFGRFLFGLPDVRLRLARGPVAAHRVRARAVDLFRVAVEGRTRAATGVLLYVSLAERRAEIVADRAINDRVEADAWGEAMRVLIAAIHDGRPGDGMVAAVEQIGARLAKHFPRAPDDTNELPDRVVVL